MIKDLFDDLKTNLYYKILALPFFIPVIVNEVFNKSGKNYIMCICYIFLTILYIVLFTITIKNNGKKLKNKINNFPSDSKFISSCNKESILEHYSMRKDILPLSLEDSNGWTNLFDKSSEIFNNIINKNKYNYNITSEITLNVGGFVFCLQKCNIEIYTRPHEVGLANKRTINSVDLLSGILFKINADYIDPIYLKTYADKNICNLCGASVSDNYYGFDESKSNVYIYVGHITMEDPSYYPYFDYSKDIEEFDKSLSLPIEYIVKKFFKDDLKYMILNYLK